ncbi:phage tail protein [Intestinibacillus massiliensis]|uniref:phage tail protein n=1 Tax=Intestinibacillus massiliensis TaxID=1871029 RepID=UPI000B3578FA|nr:phage tail protein [Intestinibacillus massiliensis]
MAIGTYGGIVFETSDKCVLTPQSLQRTSGGSWATHKLHGVKPRTEFIAPSLRKVTFKLTLLATLGVQPRALLERLTQIAESRQAYPLVIGGKPLSDNPFRLMNLSESWDRMYNGGELVSATVSVTLEEYV